MRNIFNENLGMKGIGIQEYMSCESGWFVETMAVWCNKPCTKSRLGRKPYCIMLRIG